MRLFESEIFGNDLADDDVGVTNKKKRESKGYAVEQHSGRTKLKGSEATGEQAIEGVFAGPTEAKAGERDTDLSDREQAAGVCQKAEGTLRTGLTLFRKLPEA